MRLSSWIISVVFLVWTVPAIPQTQVIVDGTDGRSVVEVWADTRDASQTPETRSAPYPLSLDSRTGTVDFMYVVVDFEDFENPVSPEGASELVRLVREHYRRVSHGKLDLRFYQPFPRRITIPFSNAETCERRDPKAWAEYVDANVDFAKDDTEGRLYFMPRVGACDFAGLGTYGGNFLLPLPSGSYVRQSWVMVPTSEFITIHELGHNLRLLHANGPWTAEDRSGQEYGDRSSVMGGYAYNLFPARSLHEMRGFNGVEKDLLGWLKYRIVALESGHYRISRVESEMPETPQLLVIPIPPYELEAVFLSYRTGSDGWFATGEPARIEDRFTDGLSIHVARTYPYTDTMLEATLADGDVWTSPERLGAFVRVQQLDHNDESVDILIEFTPSSSNESLFNPGSCSDGIDNDNDHRIDFDGNGDMGPESFACPRPWGDLLAPATVRPEDRYTAICKSDHPDVGGIGPVLIFGGSISAPRFEEGVGYLADVIAPDECGQTQILTCGSINPRVLTQPGPVVRVEVPCQPDRLRPVSRP